MGARMGTTHLSQKSQVKQVIFKLGSEEYGLDIMLVNAIEKYTSVVPIPNAPSYIKGIINLRGDVIPVYSLRKKFGLLEKGMDENTMLIVTKSRGILMAYEVDQVDEILEISSDNISETPFIVRGETTSYIDSVANINGRMVILLNHDGILSVAEKESIETYVLNKG